MPEARTGCLTTHIPQGVSRKRSCVKAARIVDVNRRRSNLEYVVVEAENMLVCPEAQAAILGQTVSADTWAWKNHVAVCGTGFDCLYYLN